ncbi:MAG: hypothetical protein J6Q83_03320 [Clostridia bacterium]|nr:hypothetical protein [Clostridia bacterium]
MKYKVSLLPEKNRKRINGKKKAEKVKVIALVALFMMLALIIIVLGGKLVADRELSKIHSMNNEYEMKVQGLSHYREISDTLQKKVQLIKDIQVEEPSLYNFIALLSNVEHTDVSITAIECTEWKTSRICVLTGTCQSRQSFNEYMEKLKAIEGVNPESVMCTAYTVTYTDGKAVADFSISLTCSGGAAPIVVEESTDAAAETEEATDVAVE